METSQSSTPKPARTFWQRPEGKVGTGIMAGLGVALGYAFYKALPTLIQLAENTLYLAGLVGIIALLYCVVIAAPPHATAIRGPRAPNGADHCLSTSSDTARLTGTPSAACRDRRIFR